MAVYCIRELESLTELLEFGHEALHFILQSGLCLESCLTPSLELLTHHREVGGREGGRGGAWMRNG